MAQQPQRDSRSLYHRWRSRSFSEVVAQEHVTRTLRNAVAAGRIVHAYLFCGPRGTGKTSTARILAKAVNCLDPQEGEPCNRCPSCAAVTEGRAIDLIEIDAASNRGIDDARDLREKIKYSPAEARYKVYIIDEAHMLTSEASNALLKTLEEPPAHAILILATTEAHKILPTIISRCQRFDFRRIPLQAVVEQLEMISEREGLGLEKGVLDRVARMARGSLRDAESLLDQLVAYCGDRIELASAREILGLTGEEVVPEFADALRGRDLALGFRLIDSAASRGADLWHLSRELVDHLRALMVAKSGAETSLTREFRPEELVQLRASAESWSYRPLLAALRTFGELEGRARLEPINQVHLETAFVEVALVSEDGSSAADAATVAVAPARTAAPGTLPTPAGVPTLSEAALPYVPIPDAARSPAPQAEPVSTAEPPLVVPSAARSLDLAGVRREWPRISAELAASGSHTPGIALPGCHPLGVSGTTITFGFEKTLWRGKMDKPEVRREMEELLARTFGDGIRVRLEFGVKISRETAPPGRDAVVETAVRDLGFKISRVETTSG